MKSCSSLMLQIDLNTKRRSKRKLTELRLFVLGCALSPADFKLRSGLRFQLSGFGKTGTKAFTWGGPSWVSVKLLPLKDNLLKRPSVLWVGIFLIDTSGAVLALNFVDTYEAVLMFDKSSLDEGRTPKGQWAGAVWTDSIQIQDVPSCPVVSVVENDLFPMTFKIKVLPQLILVWIQEMSF